MTPSPNFLDPAIVRSRRALLNVLRVLEQQREALTIIGAHAVAERTFAVPDLPPADSTTNADLGVTPALLNDVPNLAAVMASAGFELASDSRPGVWGLSSEMGLDLHARLTVDLIAPASVAGGGRRSADVGHHGGRSVSRTTGTELALIDRDLLEVRSFDGSPSAVAYVAGGAALICAKAYKLYDRMDPREVARNPARLRPKDAADLYRLILATPAARARVIFDAGAARPDLTAAVDEGRRRVSVLLGEGRDLASMVADAWSDYDIDVDQVAAIVTAWLADFERRA